MGALLNKFDKPSDIDTDDEQVFDDIIAENKDKKWKDLVIDYAFLLWDGLGFFGTAIHKLWRLRGYKPRWFDRFRSF